MEYLQYVSLDVKIGLKGNNVFDLSEYYSAYDKILSTSTPSIFLIDSSSVFSNSVSPWDLAIRYANGTITY